MRAPLLLLPLLWLATAAAVHAQDPALRFGGQVPPEVDAVYERALRWLVAAQSPEGDWKDQNQGAAIEGICLMAFLASGEDPNFGRYASSIRRAVRSLVKRQDAKTGYLGGSMYHHGFGMLALAEAYGAVDETLLWEGAAPPRSLGQALQLAVGCAVTAQKKNEFGGWRYSPDSSDADTSVTGAVLMGLFAARNAGLDVPRATLEAAMDYMRRSTGEDGSVAYSGGLGGMGGSMNLTAISTLVGAISRTRESAQFQASLRRLLDNLEHRESGMYGEYFRYYMAQALFQGDYAAWLKWNGGLVRQLRESQREDGSFGGAYQTGMTLLSLALNYRFLPIYER